MTRVTYTKTTARGYVAWVGHIKLGVVYRSNDWKPCWFSWFSNGEQRHFRTRREAVAALIVDYREVCHIPEDATP